MNDFPQDPNLRSWSPPKAVVITHGSPAHLRSGIKRENAISKKANQRLPAGPQSPLLEAPKAVVIPHGSPAHLRSGIK